MEISLLTVCSLCRNLYVSCTIYANGKAITQPARTTYSNTKLQYWSWTVQPDFSRWNEWLELPVKLCELPLNSQFVITIWNVFAPRKKIPVGGTSFSLFGKNRFSHLLLFPHNCRALRKGKQKLIVWPNVQGDGSLESTTPGKTKAQSELDRIEKVIKRYDRGQIPRLDWLDKVTFKEIENLKQVHRLIFLS